jgi:DNA ligase (NAD+)
MKIKGLGPSTIKKLGLWEIYEIYELPIEDLTGILGDKVGTKIFTEIDKTRECDFATYLSALSIPLIGTVASEKIGQVVNNIDDITYDVLYEAGLGNRAKENLLEWLDENRDTLPEISFKPKKANKAPSLGKKVCITGKLQDFRNRAGAAEYLKSLGYTVTTTVSKQTDYLVDEEGKKSSKRTKAEQLNIPIVHIKDLEEKNQ